MYPIMIPMTKMTENQMGSKPSSFIIGNERGAGHALVSVLFEIVEESFSELFAGGGTHEIRIRDLGIRD